MEAKDIKEKTKQDQDQQDVNQTNENGETLLHKAVKSGDVSCPCGNAA